MIPIGSLVQIKNMDAIIIGYSISSASSTLSLRYKAIPFPRGYTAPTCIKLLDEEDITVVSQGFFDEKMIKFMELISDYQNGLEKVKETFPDEFGKMLNSIQEEQ